MLPSGPERGPYGPVFGSMSGFFSSDPLLYQGGTLVFLKKICFLILSMKGGPLGIFLSVD